MDKTKIALYTTAYYFGYSIVALFGIFLLIFFQHYKTHWYILLIAAILILFGLYNLFRFHRFRRQSALSISDPFVGAVLILLLIALLWYLVHPYIALIFVPIAIMVLYLGYRNRKAMPKPQVKMTIEAMPPRILTPFPINLFRPLPRKKHAKKKLINPFKEQKEAREKYRQQMFERFKR